MTTDQPAAATTSDPGSDALVSSVEAILLTSARPITADAIRSALGPAAADLTPRHIDAAVEALNAALDQTGRAARVERVAGGYRLMTRPEHAPVLAAIRQQQLHGKLSRAAVETLAIIAYKQPITRADIEVIRGVDAGGMLRNLLDLDLIEISGHRETIGRPPLYGTTALFLRTFGLRSLSDLPSIDELRALLPAEIGGFQRQEEIPLTAGPRDEEDDEDEEADDEEDEFDDEDEDEEEDWDEDEEIDDDTEDLEDEDGDEDDEGR